MNRALQERAMEGGREARLSREQKAKVCKMAQAAWERLGRPMFEDEEMPEEMRMGKSLAFETWRQREQEHLTGKKSLREMGQGDFCLLMAHFAQIAEDYDAAQFWGERAESDGKRRALWQLKQELERCGAELGHAERYAAAIARDKFGTTDFGQLSERQVWTLVFDLRRAAGRKRRGAMHGKRQE